ncbi:TRAP transporter fused permease subunit [Bacillus sp. B15-48]|uniref:TRAP transporter permease n=1 Tax=Bacillus sp. B15-48 TaxID=1548601 RepID=UPI00193F3539|nr:TRAP transporter fused permease subunit [Bacillus sp. B15-48]MBM4763686.1 TRAP transporter fused permease subunit [Bacillus sp. B15-48]
MNFINKHLEGVDGSNTRKIIIFTVAILYTTFHLYTAGIKPFTSLIQTSVHIGFGLFLVYLLHPLKKKGVISRVADYFFIIAGFVSSAYVVIHYERFIMDPFGYGSLDIFLGTLLIIAIIEGSRRTIGFTVPILTICMLLYTSFGHLIPGKWGHGKMEWDFIVSNLYMTGTGIYGQIVLIVATVIAIFLIFGASLESTGAGNSFMGIALKLTGKSAGGPAKVSVISSAFFGSISGNAAANVAVTGSFTIPLMKKLKYPSPYAAAVEASASTLGQIMPPIMGAAAFIMAQFLMVSYLDIVVAAIIPALLFTLGIFMTIHFDAKKKNLVSIESLNQSQNNENDMNQPIHIPSWRELLTFNLFGTLVLPIIALLYIIGEGYTVQLACFYAVIISWVSFIIQDFKFSRIKERLAQSVTILISGAKAMASIVPLVACAQIIVSLLGKTGLGVKIGNMIVSLGADSLLLSLFAAMGLALILGMGVPTTAAYVLGASMAAPALIELGIPAVSAHFFVMYFSVVSAITPPICTGVFIAAGIAKSNWLKTAIIAVRLSFAAFIVPFIFAYNGSLLLVDGFNGEVFIHIATAIVGVISFCSMSAGYLIKINKWYESTLCGIAAILMIVPVVALSSIGFSLFLIVLIGQYFSNSFQKRVSENI